MYISRLSYIHEYLSLKKKDILCLLLKSGRGIMPSVRSLALSKRDVRIKNFALILCIFVNIPLIKEEGNYANSSL